MTVAEIKDYIDEQLNIPSMFEETRSILQEIKSMLDELEPKAKWVKKNNAYYCSNCGSEYHTSSITPLPNVCIECNARMEEVEE